MRDLRRTVETHMAALGISSDVLAQIQSHGLGGVQARHYGCHDYMPEKRAALQVWVHRFTGLNGIKRLDSGTRISSPSSRPQGLLARSISEKSAK